MNFWPNEMPCKGVCLVCVHTCLSFKMLAFFLTCLQKKKRVGWDMHLAGVINLNLIVATKLFKIKIVKNEMSCELCPQLFKRVKFRFIVQVHCSN